MADAETVMQITGFAPGGVCPFALRQQVSVYLDNSLKEYDITFIAAGTPHSALPISAEMLEKVTGGSWVDATK
jgi:prolyl-tRNA editing enzyme YbaK/EbsC (Cys-tRNA(Pro) deacylase)